jgi:thioredoxin-like negative regulator of GroEL
MLTPDLIRDSLAAGLPYEEYIKTGTPDQQASWAKVRAAVALTTEQQALVKSFIREIHVLVTSGMWCGDCAHQVPMLDAIAQASNGRLHLALVDRDEHKALANMVRICGGNRVPTVIFANEDYEFLGLYGDKSLARLRAIAQRSLGASCMIPSASLGQNEMAATIGDWVGECERVHLIARLSPRLRDRHGD